jgi:tetratricopeptide (TPR) repeat protein
MKIHKIALLTLITLLTTIGQTPINLPAIVGITQALAQTPQARKAEADRLLKQGNQQLQTSQFEAALQSLNQALTLYREIKDYQGEGWTLAGLGLVYVELQNYPQAINYYQQSLVIARKIKYSTLEALVESMLTNAQIKSNPRKAEADKLLEQGFEKLKVSHFEAALQSLNQALILYREIKDRQGEGIALSNLSIAYVRLGDYPKAIEYLQQSLAIARELKNLGGEAEVLNVLGATYSLLGDYKKAIDYHQQSLAIARELKQRQHEGKVLGDIGAVYFELGDYKKSLDYLQQDLAIARELKNRDGERRALNHLGATYHVLGDYKKAIDYLQQSLAIARELKQRQHEVLGNLGLIYGTLGEYKKAIEYLQQTLAIAREIKDSDAEGKTLSNLGFTLYKEGNLAEAEKTLYEGIKVYESLRDKKLPDNNKVSLFDTQRSTYRTLQQVLIAQNKTNAALEIAERGRARAFVELLASRVSTNNKQADKSPEPPTIADIKQIAEQQNATLVQYSIIVDEFKISGKQQIKESDLYIWVVKPTGEVTFRKVDIKPLWQKDNTTLAKLLTVRPF